MPEAHRWPENIFSDHLFSWCSQKCLFCGLGLVAKPCPALPEVGKHLIINYSPVGPGLPFLFSLLSVLRSLWICSKSLPSGCCCGCWVLPKDAGIPDPCWGDGEWAGVRSSPPLGNRSSLHSTAAEISFFCDGKVCLAFPRAEGPVCGRPAVPASSWCPHCPSSCRV